jgi:serine/threonine protein kinase/outer membrane protein assembly factor BamD (BamD/ComL family)/predicted kinase
MTDSKTARTPLPGAEPGGAGARLDFDGFSCTNLSLLSGDGASGLVYIGVSADFYGTQEAALARLVIKECYPLELSSASERHGDALVLAKDSPKVNKMAFERYCQRYREAFAKHTLLYQGPAREQTSVPNKAYEANGTVYIISDASNGVTLDKAFPTMDIATQLKLLVRLSEALAAMHSSGLLYLDVKPQNILTLFSADTVDGKTYSGEVKLFDFDSVTAMAELESQQALISGSGDWSAYEQAHEGYTDKVGPASDLYSVGALLFWLVAGRPPTTNEVIHADGDWDIPQSVVVHPAFSGDDSRALRKACGIFNRTLVTEPGGRYQQAQDLRADLTVLEEILMPTNKTHSDEHRGILNVVQTLPDRNFMAEMFGYNDRLSTVEQMLSQLMSGGMSTSAAMSVGGFYPANTGSANSENTEEDIAIATQNVVRLEKQLENDPDNGTKACLLAMALVILCYAQKAQETQEAEATVAQIRELADRFPKNDEIALHLLNGTLTLAFKAAADIVLRGFPQSDTIKEKIDSVVSVVETQSEKHPNNSMFAGKLCQGLLLKVTFKLDDNETALNRIDALFLQYPAYEPIAKALTYALFARSFGQEPGEAAASISRIEELTQRFPESEEIASSLASALSSLSRNQEPGEASSSISRIEALTQRFPESEEIACSLATSLRELAHELSPEETTNAVARIEELAQRFPESGKIGVALADALTALAGNQESEEAKATLLRSWGLLQHDPKNEVSATHQVSALYFLSIKQEPDAATSSISRIEELAQRFPKNLRIASFLAGAISLLTRKSIAAGKLEPEDAAASISRIEKLVQRFPESEEIALSLAAALSKLVYYQELEETAVPISRIRDLAQRFPESEGIADWLASALSSLSDKQEPEQAAASVVRIEELAQRFPESEGIGDELAAALSKLVYYQEPGEAAASISRIRDLAQRFPESEGIAFWLAKSLPALAHELSPEETANAVTRIEKAAEDNPQLALLADILPTVSKLDHEKLVFVIACIEELMQRFPEDEKIAFFLMRCGPMLLGEILLGQEPEELLAAQRAYASVMELPDRFPETKWGSNILAYSKALSADRQDMPDAVPTPTPANETAVDYAMLRNALKATVIGQDNIIDECVDALRVASSPLAQSSAPVSFLFAGATGTGKTFLAEQIAEGMGLPLLRLDMSEFTGREALSRLIGSPPGYLGSQRDAQLVGWVKKHPRSLLLFDEIDKTEPGVLDILMQILDKGEFSSASGAQFSIKDSVVICTTNASQTEISKADRRIGFSGGAADSVSVTSDALKGIRKLFKPELLNRFSRLCVFNRLVPADIERLTDVKLAPRLEDWRERLNLTVVLDDSARSAIRCLAYDDKSGTRELNRVIDRVVIKGIMDALGPDEIENRKVTIASKLSDVEAATTDELIQAFSYDVQAVKAPVPRTAPVGD